MAKNAKTSVKPFLTVNNGEKAVYFYTSAFGAIEKKRFEMPDKKLSSILEIEKAAFYVGDDEAPNGNVNPDQKSNSPIRMILQTTKADALFENALRYGATVICPMTTEAHWRIGKLKDPFGHIWEIGYPL
jgi:PhnB protein